MDKFLQKNLFSIALFMLICPLFLYFNYELERSNTSTLFLFYGLIFLATSVLIIKSENQKFLLGTGLILRILILFSVPNLSQDFYRFIWDGRMLFQGLNPYVYLPDDLMQSPDFHLSQAQELYDGMGALSSSHYTNYPPVNQFVFWFASLLSKHSILGSIVVFKVVIILADIGIFHFGRKILAQLNLNPKLIFWYFLNPLVLTELTGNLHFEGVMIFFFVWSFYHLLLGNWIVSALLLGCSISVKLLPLIVLPLFFQNLGFKKSVWFYTITIGLNILLFLPFLDKDFIDNYSESVGLWFTNFEFNASIYYIIREIGYWIKGYNIIQTTGKYMPLLFLVFVGIITFFRKNKNPNQLLSAMLLVLSVYFFQSTTIHPWYIINLVILGVFTGYLYPIVWSLVAILSYSAYRVTGFQENFFLIGLEYILVYGVFVWEVFGKGKLNDFTNRRLVM